MTKHVKITVNTDGTPFLTTDWCKYFRTTASVFSVEETYVLKRDAILVLKLATSWNHILMYLSSGGISVVEMIEHFISYCYNI
jgi:hypothetical protein